MVTKLSELLDDVCAMYKPRLQASNIELQRNYAIAGEVTVYPSELRQVFTNLITNSIDAIGKNGRLTISIEEATEHQVMVKVCDTGCGIPEENLKAIFEPFLQHQGRTGYGDWTVGDQRHRGEAARQN